MTVLFLIQSVCIIALYGMFIMRTNYLKGIIKIKDKQLSGEISSAEAQEELEKLK